MANLLNSEFLLLIIDLMGTQDLQGYRTVPLVCLIHIRKAPTTNGLKPCPLRETNVVKVQSRG